MAEPALSGLEALPTELLAQIIEDLISSEELALARLLRCSKSLRQRIEPALYERADVRNRAMRWGCARGNVDTIRLVVSYGAPVSTVLVPVPLAVAAAGYVVVFTLSLAAKNRQAETFRVLLELGARVDLPPSLGGQPVPKASHLARLRQLVNHIFSHRTLALAPELAWCFFEAGLDEQARKAGQGPDVYQPLVRFIRSGAPTKLVELLLARGADPNRIYAGFHSSYAVSPLSAAIIAGSPEVARLLVTRGAAVHGQDLPRPTRRALHRPAFAAACALAAATTAQSYDVAAAMVQLCVDSGADFKQQTSLMGTPRPYRLSEMISVRARRRRRNYLWLDWEEYYHGTPLHAFLDTVARWEPDLPVKRGVTPTTEQPRRPWPGDGIRLLVSHGVPVGIGAGREPPQKIRPPRRRGGRRVFVSPLELCLKKWGLDTVAVYPGFLAVVRLLIEEGGAKGDHAYLLTNFIAPLQAHATTPEARAYITAQRMVADLLVADVSRGDEASQVLWRYVLALARGPNRLGETSYAVIDFLIEQRGADVNAEFRDINDRGEPQPILHMLSRNTNNIEKNAGDIGSFVSSAAETSQGEAHRNLVRLLVLKGADPRRISGGKTAIDVLLDGLDKMDPEVSAKYLLGMAAILRGEDTGRLMVYQPRKSKWKARPPGA